jgi:hypothetical protein
MHDGWAGKYLHGDTLLEVTRERKKQRSKIAALLVCGKNPESVPFFFAARSSLQSAAGRALYASLADAGPERGR